jgi:hypothetical protein
MAFSNSFWVSSGQISPSKSALFGRLVDTAISAILFEIDPVGYSALKKA